MTDSPVSAPSRLALRAGLVAAALLMLGALALFYVSLGGKSAAPYADSTEVTVIAKGCVPNAISVPGVSGDLPSSTARSGLSSGRFSMV
ncbi:hypothetical protein ULF88_01590 [Halopseudomonas pachastrellae]|nr:hypothetical protein [Halopseudomonas pachastrellae]